MKSLLAALSFVLSLAFSGVYAAEAKPDIQPLPVEVAAWLQESFATDVEGVLPFGGANYYGAASVTVYIWWKKENQLKILTLELLLVQKSDGLYLPEKFDGTTVVSAEMGLYDENEKLISEQKWTNAPLLKRLEEEMKKREVPRSSSKSVRF